MKLGEFENELISHFNKFDVPFIFVHNKSDIIPITSRSEKSDSH